MGEFIIKDEKSTYIENTVTIGEGTIIYPNVAIRGNTIIGKNNIIDMNTIIIDSVIGDGNNILASVITDSKIGNNNEIGPYAHISKNTVINNHVTIGNYVEVVRSVIDDKTKSKHLTYLGDAQVGQGVNIGAGTITANYSPKRTKNKTYILKGAFVGSNSCLIAPVTIGENALVAAGSTITEDVKDNSLGISRAKQIEVVRKLKLTKD